MVAGTNRPEEIDPGGVRKLLFLIDSLRATPAGSLIYRQAEGMLDELAANHLRSEIAYSGFVNVLLEAFNAHQSPGSPVYVQIKLLQARLQPPLTPTELDTLSSFIDECGTQIRDAGQLDPDVLTDAISPLLEAFGINTPAAAVESQPAPVARATDTIPHDATLDIPAEEAVDYGAEPEEPELEDEFDEGEDDDYISDEIPAGQDLNAINRSELEARREDIEKLQATLGQQVLETITQNEEFGVILEVVLTELRQAEEISEIENMRWTLIREVEKLMKGHNELADKLDSTHHYLQLIESDSRELTDELTRVRLLSLTDELTSLPNRRAFMRRLEDEVARVQRYGFPLSFILMDLDHFKQVNDELGHAAGDEVLRVYSKNILSIFRHHDMVARYGGEEFAVLLPNTDSDGAVRALNKVKRRAAETRWQVNGTVSKVPTFSAGVSLYKPGESASAFIERADKALYRAKRLGRNRIELDITYESDDEGGSPRRRSTDT
jgi:diguanylate cyclase (GGDEF)-like protein